MAKIKLVILGIAVAIVLAFLFGMELILFIKIPNMKIFAEKGLKTHFIIQKKVVKKTEGNGLHMKRELYRLS